MTATDEIRLSGVGASMPEPLHSADGRVELVLGAGQLDRKVARLPLAGVAVSLLGVADRFIVVDGTLKAPHASIDSGDLLVDGAAAWATAGLSLVADQLIQRLTAFGSPCEKVLRRDAAGAGPL